MLAVITVTILADSIDFNDGQTSLREAIFATNIVPGADTINFAPSLTAGGPASIVLTQGQLSISDSLTIAGLGAGLLTIDASGNDATPTLKDGQGSRLFNIDDGTGAVLDVTISGLTLKGGDANGQGGAVNSSENLSIVDSVVSGNYGIGKGGGICSAGSAKIYGTTLSGNSAKTLGGALFAAGDAELENCTISDNQSNFGGGIYSGTSQSSPKTLIIRNSSISNNVATGEGGGIRKQFGSLLIENSTVIGNKAHHGGGMSIADNITAQISNSTISGNSLTTFPPSAPTGYGAGILLVIGNMTVTGSTVSNNTGAKLGGGIYDRSGQVTIRSSSVRGNSAVNGGGIYATTLSPIVVDSSTVSGNSATMGGGIFSNSGLQQPPVITNSTISSNIATMQGGGIFNQGGLLAIRYSTITSNSAPPGNGSGIDAVLSPRGPGATYEVQSSIIAGNINSDVDTPATKLHSSGYNLIGTGSAVALFNQPGDQTGVINPLLGPLADNGGPTMTHAPLAGSPAINAGDPAAVAGFSGVPMTEQRGAPYTRVYGGRIDIGAVESQPTDHLLGDFNRDGVVDARDYAIGRTQGGLTVARATGADANGDGKVDDADLAIWRFSFGMTYAAAATSVEGLPKAAEPDTPLTYADEKSATRLQKPVDGTVGSTSVRAGVASIIDNREMSRSNKRGLSMRRAVFSPALSHATRIDAAIEDWLASRVSSDDRHARTSTSLADPVSECAQDTAERSTSLDVIVDEAFGTM